MHTQEWNVRERLELSAALKCPTLAYQLAGTKKVQQRLFDVLEQFVPDVEDQTAIRATFMPQYSLDAVGVL